MIDTPDPRDARPQPPPILPHNWERLAPMVDAVLDAPVEQRADVLARVSNGDFATAAAVEQIVKECEADVPMLNRPAAERFAVLLAADDDVTLPEMLGGRYRIVRELGRGGMARVYLARDEKHSRDVAVKVIRPDLAASLGGDRFLREIGIAARLRHPNIVPVYDSGDADGLLYFVMPYEEGQSLRGRLTLGDRLTVPECMHALRDVARALVYAHAHGVVHRDVKPDNVMMSGGAAVVTDFGIAKAVSAAQVGVPEGTLTQAGAGLGTPAYMAPEQAIGDPSTDHRADIYSFGCLAYELFCGNPPFHSLPSHRIIAAHVGTTPVPLSEVAPHAPESVARLVARCLEKNPDARPQRAEELLAELDSAEVAPNDPPRRASVGVWQTAAMVGLALGAVGYLVWRGSAPAPRAATPAGVTLAVVGISGQQGSAAQNDIADGFADEVATALFNVEGLQVKSRATVNKYNGRRSFDPQVVGKELGARMLVPIAFRWDSTGFATTVKVVDRDGTELMAQLYTPNDGDLNTVRDKAVRLIVQKLRETRALSTTASSSPPQAGRVANRDAYELHLQAQAKLKKRGQSIAASAALFRQAMQKDTLFARAFSGFSLAWALAPYFQPTSTREVAAEATRAARRALVLDSTLAQPHIALGLIHMHAYEWAEAEAEYRTAIGLDSRDVEARVQYGRLLLFQDRIKEALEHFSAARVEDPSSALVASWMSYAFMLNGQMDSAVVESDTAFQRDSTNLTTLSLGALVKLAAGDTTAAHTYARRLASRNPAALYILSATGDSAVAFGRIREWEKRQPSRWMSETARAFALMGAGEPTLAIGALERAADRNELWPSLEAVREPLFDIVRGDPRFHRLLRRVGLPLSVTQPLRH